MSNFQSHYETTGPEIWNQTKFKITAFATSSGIIYNKKIFILLLLFIIYYLLFIKINIILLGTGGTVSGISSYLKEKNKNIQCYIVEPQGSCLIPLKNNNNNNNNNNDNDNNNNNSLLEWRIKTEEERKKNIPSVLEG